MPLSTVAIALNISLSSELAKRKAVKIAPYPPTPRRHRASASSLKPLDTNHNQIDRGQQVGHRIEIQAVKGDE